MPLSPQYLRQQLVRSKHLISVEKSLNFIGEETKAQRDKATQVLLVEMGLLPRVELSALPVASSYSGSV